MNDPQYQAGSLWAIGGALGSRFERRKRQKNRQKFAPWGVAEKKGKNSRPTRASVKRAGRMRRVGPFRLPASPFSFLLFGPDRQHSRVLVRSARTELELHLGRVTAA